MTVHWADSVARFTADWRRSQHGDRSVPRLADYVPDEGTARLGVLTELVRIDLRHRWDGAGPAKRISEYRAEFPEVTQSPALVELVCEEFATRRAQGPLPLEDFLAEYPELADSARERLAAEAERIDTNALALDSLPAEITPGRRIDDFDLLTDLGTGASGRVFLARQISMQRLVAVRLSTTGGGEPQPVARLDHPHIIRVFDHKSLRFDAEAGFGRLVYMQYLPGGTAKDVLEQLRGDRESDGGAVLLRAVDRAMETRGEIRTSDSRVREEISALSWPETVAWLGRRLADALDYADRHGVRYGVITPGDVLFTAEGEPKFGDFSDIGEKRENALPYRSPEDLATADTAVADQRGAIYSLGILLWELLTGATPFAETTDTRAALRQRRDGVPADALSRLPADCPPALRRILLTCLEPDPHRRWSNGEVLAKQLDLCLDARARDLVDPPEHGLRLRLRRWRIPLITLAILIPNMLASIYNIDYTRLLVVPQLTDEAARKLDFGAAIVNTVGFGLGAVVLVYMSRHLIFVPHGLRRGGRFSAETLRRARTDTILFGDRAILVIFTMWMLSGTSFPIVIRGTSDAITAYDYTQFVVSHAICGAIALVYPFFLVNFYVVRCIYPMFLSQGEIDEEDAVRLRKLRRRCGIWLLVAASIPLITVAGATLLTQADLETIIVELRILAIGSVIAFSGIYLLFRAMENDLRALEGVQVPATPVGTV
ncbi:MULTISPECIES: protein kinase domain-containing protein [Nocardia]|uniref:protein kinase domain-containing protein n=1 Tax=Nocardia TaxID=1817 RepID=UPI001E31C3A8|nr:MULTISPECIES: protein kinase [Nocardia]